MYTLSIPITTILYQLKEQNISWPQNIPKLRFAARTPPVAHSAPPDFLDGLGGRGGRESRGRAFPFFLIREGRWGKGRCWKGRGGGKRGGGKMREMKGREGRTLKLKVWLRPWVSLTTCDWVDVYVDETESWKKSREVHSLWQCWNRCKLLTRPGWRSLTRWSKTVGLIKVTRI